MLIGGIATRPGPRACSPAAASRNLASRPAALGPAARRRASSSGSGPRRSSAPSVPIVETLRCRCFAIAFGAPARGLWVNRDLPGHDPGLRRHPRRTRWSSSSTAATCRSGSRASTRPASRRRTSARRSTSILAGDPRRRLPAPPGPLGDIIPIPFPFIRNVASIGDMFLTAGLAFFLFASVVRVLSRGRRRSHRPASRAPALTTSVDRRGHGPRRPRWLGVAALDRPLVLGGRGRLGWPSPTVSGAAPPRPEVAEILGGTRTSDWPSTGRSRRCGPASSSRSSATGSTRSRWPPSSSTTTGSRGRGRVRRSSPQRCRTCSCRRSPARSSTAGIARRS